MRATNLIKEDFAWQACSCMTEQLMSELPVHFLQHAYAEVQDPNKSWHWSSLMLPLLLQVESACK